MGEKRRKKGEKKKEKKGEKKKRGDFFVELRDPYQSRHAERVAPKAPRGAKILCRFGLEVHNY